MGGVIYSSYLREAATRAGPTVDVTRIEKLVDQGVVTLHGGSFWEPVPEGTR